MEEESIQKNTNQAASEQRTPNNGPSGSPSGGLTPHDGGITPIMVQGGSPGKGDRRH